MAASTTQPSKKKTAKLIERVDSPAPSSISMDKASEGDEGFESPYLKELQKNIRNVNKKITNASKTDSLLAEHKGKSVDDLVAAKILNGDQRAQILKKPALQAQLAQYEEQLAQCQKIHQQYRSKADADKATLDETVTQAKVDARAEAKAEFEKAQGENLLVVSQFLRLAAYRREESEDPESDESQAIEGVLLAIYAGDHSAVFAMQKLVNGASDAIASVSAQPLITTYSSVKTLAQEYRAPGQLEELVEEPEVEESPTPEPAAETAEAGPIVEQVTNGVAKLHVEESGTETSTTNIADLSISQEWVDVKSDAANPSMGTSQSWADEVAEPAAKIADPNEGFHEVQRKGARQERDASGFRGGRGRGNGRGGQRGDGRGRGRGNNRNSGAPGRGPRRTDE